MPHAFESNLRALSIGLALGALNTAASVHAQTAPRIIYADASAPTGGTGATWTTAFRDLQAALDAANADPLRATRPIEVRISQGFYVPDRGTHNPLLSFVVASSVSLLGGFAGLAAAQPDTNDPTQFVSVLSGDLQRDDGLGFTNRADNASRVVQLTGNNNRIDGITIRGGGCNSITMFLPGTVFSRCTFADNRCQSSLGSSSAICNMSTTTLSDCKFVDNETRNAAVVGLTSCTVARSTFAGNRTTHDTTPFTDYPSTVAASSTAFVSCLFAANTSDTAGAVSSSANSVFLSCTFADNTAVRGPALYAPSPTQLWSCLFARNSASSGTPHQISANSYFYVTMHNCLLQNGAADVLTSPPYSLGGFITGNPQFVNPAGPDGNPLTWSDNDYRLAATSPCIDAGSTLPSLYLLDYHDLAGNSPVDAPSVSNTGAGYATFLDIGAFEYQPVLPPPCRADFNNSGTLSPQDIFDFLNAWFAGC